MRRRLWCLPWWTHIGWGCDVYVQEHNTGGACGVYHGGHTHEMKAVVFTFGDTHEMKAVVFTLENTHEMKAVVFTLQDTHEMKAVVFTFRNTRQVWVALHAGWTHTPLLLACGLWSTVTTAGCARCCVCGNRVLSTALYSLRCQA